MSAVIYLKCNGLSVGHLVRLPVWLLRGTHNDTVNHMTGRLTCSHPACALLKIALLTTVWGCSDGLQDVDREVYIVAVEPKVFITGDSVIIYGRGLGGSNVTDGRNDETQPVVLDGSQCRLPPIEDSVLIGGIEADVCYRDYGRIDIRVPELPPGPHYLVIRSAGRLSNAFSVNAAR